MNSDFIRGILQTLTLMHSELIDGVGITYSKYGKEILNKYKIKGNIYYDPSTKQYNYKEASTTSND